MASRKLFTEESRELTDIVVSENDKTTQHRKVGYWALVAVVGVLAVSCLGVALKFSVPMTSIKRAIPISLSNSLERDLAPKCKDFPDLQILGVTHNNLGKQGPDTGEEGLIYHVRSSRGNDFEMVVNALGTFYCPLPKFNGMHGLYATVNVASLNSAKLRFSFRDWKTKRQVTMDDFTLTFFDLDHGYGNGGVEELKFEGDWVQAVVAEDTSILVHELEGDTGAIHFKSTGRVPETRWAEEPQGLNPTAIQQGCLPQVQKITFIHSNTHGHNKKSISSILQFRGRSLNTLCPRFSGCQASCRWSVFQPKGTWEGFGDGGCTYVVHIFGFPRSQSWLDGVGCLSGTSLRLHECCATRLCSNGIWGRETRPRTFLGHHPCRCRGSAWFASWCSWWYQSATNDQRSLGWWCSPKVQQQQTSTCFGALRCHHHLWRCVRSRRSSGKPLWRFARRAHTSTRSSTEASAKTARFFGGKARCPGGFYGGSDHGNFPRWASCAMELSESQTSSQQRW